MTSLLKEAHFQQKHGVASRLQRRAAEASAPQFMGVRSPMLPDSLQSLLHEITPRRRLADLVLDRAVHAEIKEFVEEVAQAALLRSHSLEPRHTLLFVGPPGTGKTSMAEALAAELAVPFLMVRYDGLVGSYLGETAGRLQQIVNYAASMPCVLFFDEFESVGKERGDTQETGEIKRVVSSLLLHMDALPSHCVIVCATNHPEMLDRAVWRRFEVRLTLPTPNATALREWFLRTEKSFGQIGLSAKEFIDLFQGETFSEIEAVTLDARRKVVLSRGQKTPAEAFHEAVVAWDRRRQVAGASSVGAGAYRKNESRARKRRSAEGGAQTSFSEALGTSDAGDATGRNVREAGE